MPLGFAKAVFSGGGGTAETILDFTGRSVGNTGNGNFFHESITLVKDDLNIIAGEVGDDVAHHANEVSSGVFNTTDVDSIARAINTNSTGDAYVPIKSGTYEFEVTSVDNDHESGPYFINTTSAYAFNMRLQFGVAVTISGSGAIREETPNKSVTINMSKAAQADGATPDNATINHITAPTNFEERAYTDTINAADLTLPLILGKASIGQDDVVNTIYQGTSTASFRQNSGLMLVWLVAGGSGITHALGRTRITIRNA